MEKTSSPKASSSTRSASSTVSSRGAHRRSATTASSSSACGSADFLPMRHSSQHECRCARSAAASVQPSATSAQKQLQYPRASSGLRGDAWARFSSDSSFDSNDARVCDSAFSRATAATSVSNARRRSGTPRSPKPSAAAFRGTNPRARRRRRPCRRPAPRTRCGTAATRARDAARYPALAAAAPSSGAAAARDAAASACAARREDTAAANIRAAATHRAGSAEGSPCAARSRRWRRRSKGASVASAKDL